MDQTKSNAYIIGGAIIVAGLLVMFGIFAANSKKTVNSGDQAVSLVGLAEAAGLEDTEAFRQCVNSDTYTDKVNTESTDAQAAGGQGTPYNLFVTKNGYVFPISGALPYQYTKQITDRILTGVTEQQSYDTIAKDIYGMIGEEAPAAGSVKFPAVNTTDHIIGSPTATLVVVEYSDIQCPYCKQFHSTMHQIIDAYTDEGKKDDIAWVFRDFPLESIHPHAHQLAIASECFAHQVEGPQAFWTYVDSLYDNQDALVEGPVTDL
jgi:protein-disulfide isomerase